MAIHLNRDLDKLQRRVLAMASAVEQTVEKAIRALFDRDVELANDLMESDHPIDLEENQIEEDCLKILALHQPVAVDLRRVAAILKINTELERMADLAVNIAERTAALARGPEVPVPANVRQMTDLTNTMVRDSLDAFVNLDASLAKRVCRMDDEVDRHNRIIIEQASQYMKQSPANVDPGLHLFSAAGRLERIADHATNIAEDVVYLVEGKIIRHHPEALDERLIMGKSKILIVEDEPAIAEVLTYNLQREGYEVVGAREGREGLRKGQMLLPDLVILDLMLPGMNGLDICRELRASPRTIHIPILMLTAKAEETDQVVGFAVGTDDYVTKPFSVKVLLQRIKVLLRRAANPEPAGDVLEAAGIHIDKRGHSVTVDGETVSLTPTEFRLLETLLRSRAGRSRGRDFSKSAVGDTIVLDRTIDVHIKSLRRKLGKRGDRIETVRGVGYRFQKDAQE